jgi:hypothetical protein
MANLLVGQNTVLANTGKQHEVGSGAVLAARSRYGVRVLFDRAGGGPDRVAQMQAGAAAAPSPHLSGMQHDQEPVFELMSARPQLKEVDGRLPASSEHPIINQDKTARNDLVRRLSCASSGPVGVRVVASIGRLSNVARICGVQSGRST